MFWVHSETICQPVYSSSVGWDSTWLILASLYACIWTEQWLLFRSCSILENPRRFTVRVLRSMPTRLRLGFSTCQVLTLIVDVVQYDVEFSYPTVLSSVHRCAYLCSGYEMKMLLKIKADTLKSFQDAWDIFTSFSSWVVKVSKLSNAEPTTHMHT